LKIPHLNTLFILLFCLASFEAGTAQVQGSAQQGVEVSSHASGPFDVKVTPQDDKTGDSALGRFALDKQYHGDLEAVGKGQMLTAKTETKGSGAYVAIERVTGTLKGMQGGFVLQHSGTMTQNTPQLKITIVPDSGTGQLKGISGKMKINISPDGKHSYELEYTLADTHE